MQEGRRGSEFGTSCSHRIYLLRKLVLGIGMGLAVVAGELTLGDSVEMR